MTKRTWAAAVALTATMALAGCAGSPSSPGASASAGSAAASSAPSSAASASAAPASAAPSVQAANGATIKGTGYRYVVPDGWKTPKTAVTKTGPDSLAVDLTDTDGFSDNVNVIVLKTGAFSTSDVESQGTAGLKRVGATKVSVRDRVTVAGAESAHITALTSGSGAKYRVDQYYLPHDGKAYVVTFSFSPSVSQAARDKTAGSVLTTWSWT